MVKQVCPKLHQSACSGRPEVAETIEIKKCQLRGRGDARVCAAFVAIGAKSLVDLAPRLFKGVALAGR